MPVSWFRTFERKHQDNLVLYRILRMVWGILRLLWWPPSKIGGLHDVIWFSYRPSSWRWGLAAWIFPSLRGLATASYMFPLQNVHLPKITFYLQIKLKLSFWRDISRTFVILLDQKLKLPWIDLLDYFLYRKLATPVILRINKDLHFVWISLFECLWSFSIVKHTNSIVSYLGLLIKEVKILFQNRICRYWNVQDQEWWPRDDFMDEIWFSKVKHLTSQELIVKYYFELRAMVSFLALGFYFISQFFRIIRIQKWTQNIHMLLINILEKELTSLQKLLLQVHKVPETLTLVSATPSSIWVWMQSLKKGDLSNPFSGS